MKLILLEGLAECTMASIMSQLKHRIELEGKTAFTLRFPVYADKTSTLINDHLYEFPERGEQIRSFDKIKEMKHGEMFVYGKDIEAFGKFNVDEGRHLIKFMNSFNNELVEIPSIEFLEYKFFRTKSKNIFNRDANPSSITKANLFAINRNVWFANNIEKLKQYDYVIINRSYMSTLLYRIDTIPVDKINYFATMVYMNEIYANGLDQFEVKNFLIKPRHKDVQLSIMDNQYLVSHLFDITKLTRDKQYIGKIWDNTDEYMSKKDYIKHEFLDKYFDFFVPKIVDYAGPGEIYDRDLISYILK